MILRNHLEHEHEVGVGDALRAAAVGEADEPQVALVLVERPLGGAGESLPLEVGDDVLAEAGLTGSSCPASCGTPPAIRGR